MLSNEISFELHIYHILVLVILKHKGDEPPKKKSWPILRPTKHPTDCPFPGGKKSGRDSDHLRPSGAEVKNKWKFTSTPPTSTWWIN